MLIYLSIRKDHASAGGKILCPACSLVLFWYFVPSTQAEHGEIKGAAALSELFPLSPPQ